MTPLSPPAAREVAAFLETAMGEFCLPHDLDKWQEVIDHLREAAKPQLKVVEP